MILGEFIHQCMRTAGDSSGTRLSADEVMRHTERALAYALERFQVSTRRSYSIMASHLLFGGIEACQVYPHLVTLNDVALKHISRYDNEAETGWYEDGGNIHIVDDLALDDVVQVLGLARIYSISADDFQKTLVLNVDDPDTQLQWVPPAVADVVRYRVLQRACEDLGDLQKAVYFSQMMHTTEREVTASQRPSKTSQDVVKGYDF